MAIQTVESPRASVAAAKIVAGIYSQHRHGLLSIARLNCSSPDDAEEALQDALMFFIESYDPTSAAPALPWLTLTLKRRCWAIARRAGQEKQRIRELCRERDHQPSVETLARPEAVVEMRERALLRRRQLAELKCDERRALMLMGLGYSYKEISTSTGWTYTKVNRCIREGRAALRSCR
jgi:DNA-directed RNA polymerase specialized sigma24 family protein